MTISILDYKMGNISSVSRALSKNNIESFKSNFNLDFSEVLKRAVKYTLEAVILATSARVIMNPQY